MQESLVSEEIVHDLDACTVTVQGEELNPEHESLEVDAAPLQQRGIDLSRSGLGVVFTGEWATGDTPGQQSVPLSSCLGNPPSHFPTP